MGINQLGSLGSTERDEMLAELQQMRLRLLSQIGELQRSVESIERLYGMLTQPKQVTQ
jgi:hypothetical protein